MEVTNADKVCTVLFYHHHHNYHHHHQFRLSTHLQADKILRYDLEPNFRRILEQMTSRDIFDSNLAKEFYRQSFMVLPRSNIDIINDVG